MRFLGHASFEITEGSARVLIDPFLAPDNPAAVVGPDEVEPTHILLTHGHGDHVTHAVEVAKRTGAKCVALVELARGLSAGLVIGMGSTTIYHLGDTALFSDLKLIAERTPINVALIPIGGHYTMEQEDGATAAELIDADTVIPMHYDTFPPVEADPERFKRDVEASPRT